MAKQTFTVTRKARTGRTVSDRTKDAIATLSKRWDTKSDRAEVTVLDPEGNEVETYAALVVDAPALGYPEGYTGLPGIIGRWAKANGHAVKVSKVSDSHYAIRPKG